MGKKFEYLVSVIIPVYNTERYLDECLQSVLDQTIGFEENIQVVLVNDGSTDGSGALCAGFRDAHPDNVVYIDKPNEGVSVARNAGLDHATGRYVNFLDSDDKWSEDAFEVMVDFLEREDVRICAARHMYFDALEAPHMLAYKFEFDHVIDVRESYDCPQLSFSNALVDGSLFDGRRFDSSLDIAEDFFLFGTIMLDELRYGVVSRPTYWYRRRTDGSSALNGSRANFSWYLGLLRYCHERLFDLSRAKHGEILLYIQYCVMYELQWRIKSPFLTPLDGAQAVDYENLLIGLLEQIDDQVILAQRFMTCGQMMSALALKHHLSYEEACRCVRFVDGEALWERPGIPAQRLWPADRDVTLHIDFFNVFPERNVIRVEGCLDTFVARELVSVVAIGDGLFVEGRIFDRPDRTERHFFDEGFSSLGFELEVPISTFSFSVRLDGCSVTPQIRWGANTPLSGKTLSSVNVGKYNVQPECETLRVRTPSRVWRVKRELLYERAALGRPEITREDVLLRRRALLSPASRKRIWLLSDRIVMAGDNGEALFAYLQEHPVPGVETYFVLGRGSSDWDRMSSIGKVIEQGSARHKLLHLKADLVISSAADDYVTNPFGRADWFFRDLFRFKFVFLQHGVIKDDLSDWLRRWSKDIRLLVTSAPQEADSIVGNSKYGYPEANIARTGLPRHDELLRAAERRESKKRVLVAPTWRKDLSLPLDGETGTRERFPGFVDSDYFRFYDALLNDERLAEAVGRLGYEVDFLLHPALIQELPAFSSGFANVVTEYDYREEFLSSAVMVTDYSSAVFDFAMLRKPIVYAQFDKDEFFSGHLYDPGYFSYEDDGFGPVVYNYEATIEAILRYMENPVMEDEYKERVEGFFYWPERPRCELLVEKLLEL